MRHYINYVRLREVACSGLRVNDALGCCLMVACVSSVDLAQNMGCGESSSELFTGRQFSSARCGSGYLPAHLRGDAGCWRCSITNMMTEPAMQSSLRQEGQRRRGGRRWRSRRRTWGENNSVRPSLSSSSSVWFRGCLWPNLNRRGVALIASGFGCDRGLQGIRLRVLIPV